MDLVHRLYHRLVESASERGEGGHTEFTVADLYQHLIPYRAVRSELGVFELAQYENGLLRLLAGEGGYLRIADEAARAEMGAELRSPNPILGIYRDYASRPVELMRPGDLERPSRSPGSERADPASPLRIQEEFPDASAFATDDLQGEPSGDVREVGDAEPLPELRYPIPSPLPADHTRVERTTAAPMSPRAGAGEGGCLACGLPLPDVEGLRFCPHCGSDQTAVPCERCGTPIRAEWNFCIRCGARRPAERPPS